MARRYELSDTQWERIAHLLPGKRGDRGRTGSDIRQFVNGVLWILRGPRIRLWGVPEED
jgi:transposase